MGKTVKEYNIERSKLSKKNFEVIPFVHQNLCNFPDSVKFVNHEINCTISYTTN